jgi:hypothetical protein
MLGKLVTQYRDQCDNKNLYKEFRPIEIMDELDAFNRVTLAERVSNGQLVAIRAVSKHRDPYIVDQVRRELHELSNLTIKLNAQNSLKNTKRSPWELYAPSSIHYNTILKRDFDHISLTQWFETDTKFHLVFDVSSHPDLQLRLMNSKASSSMSQYDAKNSGPGKFSKTLKRFSSIFNTNGPQTDKSVQRSKSMPVVGTEEPRAISRSFSQWSLSLFKKKNRSNLGSDDQSVAYDWMNESSMMSTDSQQPFFSSPTGSNSTFSLRSFTFRKATKNNKTTHNLRSATNIQTKFQKSKVISTLKHTLKKTTSAHTLNPRKSRMSTIDLVDSNKSRNSDPVNIIDSDFYNRCLVPRDSVFELGQADKRHKLAAN